MRAASRRLRLPAHRGTTAALASAYPCQAEAGLGAAGPYLGADLLAGGAGFCFDPFLAYRAGLVSNPNILVAGEPGVGKSAATKALLHRLVGVFGRWVAVADPKGEYLTLAGALGLQVVALRPGGSARLNPLDQRGGEDPEERAMRQSATVAALVGSVMQRDLSPVEDAVVGWAVTALARAGGHPTLADLVTVLGDPPPEMAERARTTPVELARAVEAPRYALGKLLDRSLRGMFDGATTVALGEGGRGVVIDLSAVHADPEALGLVLVATTAWLQGVLATGDRVARLQVLDEAWALLANERTVRFLQSCWKLCRSYGVANVAVVHRLSDLRAQADDGSATAKVSMGLLADTATRVLFRQSSDQVADARALLGLSGPEADLVGRLVKGRALWKVGGRSAVVQHHLSAAELALCDTDAAMAG